MTKRHLHLDSGTAAHAGAPTEGACHGILRRRAADAARGSEEVLRLLDLAGLAQSDHCDVVSCDSGTDVPDAPPTYRVEDPAEIAAHGRTLATLGLILFTNEAVAMIFGRQPPFVDIPPALSGTLRVLPGLDYPVMRLALRFPILGIALFATLGAMHHIQDYIWSLGLAPELRDYLIRATKVMALLGTLAVCLCLYAVLRPDMTGVIAVISISLCLSLMFPTIYGVALAGLGEATKFGAAGLVMAIVGGAIAVVALGLSACATGESPPAATPAGAVVLRQNVPAEIETSTVVATNVDGNDVTLGISDGGAIAKPTPTSEGSSVTIAGDIWQVRAVWSEGEPADAPGASAGRVMLVPAG